MTALILFKSHTHMLFGRSVDASICDFCFPLIEELILVCKSQMSFP